MAKILRGVFRRGTAAELADHAIGFSANGESMWSRNSANPKGDGKRNRRRSYSPEEEISVSKTALAKLHQSAGTETDPVKLTKLRKNIEIKTRYIAKLGAE